MPSIHAALVGTLALALAMPAGVAAQAAQNADVPDIPAAVESTFEMQTVGISGLVTLGAPGEPESFVMMDAGGQVDFGAERRAWLEGQFIDVGGLSVIFDGNDAYLGGDGFEGLVPAGMYIHIDMDSPPPPFADLATEFMIGNDAALALYWLLGAAGPVAVLGQQEVRGVDSVHIEMAIDLDLVEPHVPPELKTVFAENLAEIRANGADVDHAEAWIDGDGLIRRAAYDMQAGAPEAPLTLSIVYEFFDFGMPIELPLPDSAHIVEAWELLE